MNKMVYYCEWNTEYPITINFKHDSFALTPERAKQLLSELTDAVNRYNNKQNGEITIKHQ